MLQQHINHNKDLKRLIDDGYEVEINDRRIYLHSIPYLKSNKEVAYATLFCPFNIQGFKISPMDHTMYYLGDTPCDKEGNPLVKIFNSENIKLGDDLVANRMFSSKPLNRGYKDFYEKFTTYIAIISNEARALYPEVTAKTCVPIKLTEIDSVFQYLDTNSSRANIDFLNKKFYDQRIAIIGLGGTGSYILDFVAKTPTKEIHLYDGDTFSTHNAFRSPGAASTDILDKRPSKVDYLRGIYSNMHKMIIPHNEFVEESNFQNLLSYDFVFVCIDNNRSRMIICSFLMEHNIKFLDVGLGVNLVNDQLSGSVRVSYPINNDIVVLENHCGKGNIDDDLYISNIQIAELNALNAALAIIKWKGELGYYSNTNNYHTSIYSLAMNKIIYE
jgi:uba/thif-type NAD/fad binding fold protein